CIPRVLLTRSSGTTEQSGATPVAAGVPALYVWLPPPPQPATTRPATTSATSGSGWIRVSTSGVYGSFRLPDRRLEGGAAWLPHWLDAAVSPARCRRRRRAGRRAAGRGLWLRVEVGQPRRDRDDDSHDRSVANGHGALGAGRAAVHDRHRRPGERQARLHPHRPQPRPGPGGNDLHLRQPA